MKRKKLLLIVLTSTFITTLICGCSTFDDRYKEQFTQYGRPVTYPIHKNFHVGDYSILTDTNVTYTISSLEKIENDKIVINEATFIENKYAPKFLRLKFDNKYYSQIIVDKRGNVIESYIVDTENNRKDLLTNSIKVEVIKDDNNIYKIKTQCGEFDCKLFFGIINLQGINYYLILFKNEEVKFCTVKQYTLLYDEFEEFKKLPVDEKSKYRPSNYLSKNYAELFEQGTK